MYNVFIKTGSRYNNLLFISDEQLQVVIDAYNDGLESFFLRGEKIWLKDLFEIKIFSINQGWTKEMFDEQCKRFKLYTNSIVGTVIMPGNLNKYGEVNVN